MLIMKIIMALTNFSERGQLLPASDQTARAGDAVALAGHLEDDRDYHDDYDDDNGTCKSPAMSILQVYKFTVEGIFSTKFRQKSTYPKAIIAQSKASQG